MYVCQKRLRDLLLFVNVVLLAVFSQSLKTKNISVSWHTLERKKVFISTIEVDEAYCAVNRVFNRLGMIPGFLSTCLARCLVMGRLLAHKSPVDLHIGFSSDGLKKENSGHAWLSVDGKIVSEYDLSSFERRNYVELRKLRLK